VVFNPLYVFPGCRLRPCSYRVDAHSVFNVNHYMNGAPKNRGRRLGVSLVLHPALLRRLFGGDNRRRCDNRNADALCTVSAQKESHFGQPQYRVITPTNTFFKIARAQRHHWQSWEIFQYSIKTSIHSLF